MRNRFDQELDRLNQELIEMGALIECAIQSAVSALLEKKPELAKKTAESDAEIDTKEKEIERRCLRLLLQQQPVAADLRTVSTALKMITDMERIGDQSQDIAEISLRLTDADMPRAMEHIPQMAWTAARMVTGAIDAFVTRELDRAKAVVSCDDVMDDLFVQARDDLIAVIQQTPKQAEQAMDLMMVAKYFERIGDHAVNIAEWVIFSITGEHSDQKVL